MSFLGSNSEQAITIEQDGPVGSQAGEADGRWESLLDEMESRLALHREALSGSCPVPPEVVLPPDIGQMPASLRRRAESILVLTEAVRQSVEEAKASIGRAIAQSRPQERSSPVFLDKKA